MTKPLKTQHNTNEVEDFSILFRDAVARDEFIKLTISNPTRGDIHKIIVNSFESKGEIKFSFDERHPTQSITKTKTLDEAVVALQELIGTSFEAASMFTTKHDYQRRSNRRGEFKIVKSKATMKKLDTLSHNKQKKYLVPQEAKFLQTLGLSQENGKIIPSRYAKYRQICKFVEIVDHSLKKLGLLDKQTLSFLDVGCGKGYLTFALYNYLSTHSKNDVHGLGIDIREDVIEFCKSTSANLGTENLSFTKTAVENLAPSEQDILIALHACDTTTDHAIYQGIASDASLIIVAPCCQHELSMQIRNNKPDMAVFKHGLFLEKQTDLVTDVARSLLLESLGYRVKVIEFVASEHSMKNTLLVAEKTNNKKRECLINYRDMKNNFGFKTHCLETLLVDNGLIS